jgi:hypothetical protein
VVHLVKHSRTVLCLSLVQSLHLTELTETSLHVICIRFDRGPPTSLKFLSFWAFFSVLISSHVSFMTERQGGLVGTSASRSGGTDFRSRNEDWPSL